MARKINARQDAFLNWMLLTDAQRVSTDQPTTQAEWCRRHGVGERTVRDWKKNADFVAELDERRKRLTATVNLDAGTYSAPDAGVAPEVLLAGLATTAGAGGGDAAGEFAAARAMLLSLVSKGDKTALDLWFKTFGKPFVEAEQASFKSDFRDLSNDELLERAARLLPTSLIQDELGRRLAAGPALVSADGE